MYKYIFIDLDDTLFDFQDAQKVAFNRLVDHLGLKTSASLFEEFKLYNVELWTKVEQGDLSKSELIESRFYNFFATKTDTPLPHQLDDTFREYLVDATELVPGSKEILDYLKSKGYHLFAATNGIKNTQFARLKRLNIIDYFNNIFISEVLGYEKPSKLFFETCFKSIIGIDLTKTIMIGDSLSSDIQGAINVGIDCIWFNPMHKPNPYPLKVDYQIQALNEIKYLL